jgi:hypothetical protein
MAICSCERPLKSVASLKVEPLSPDITVEFASQAKVTDGKIEFQLMFKNIGSDMDSEVTMFSKPFLVPLGNIARNLVGQGLVLAPIASQINLRKHESKTITVTSELPSMSTGEYFLGVTINSRAALLKEGEYVTETTDAQLNNVTEQLLNLGALPAYAAPPLSGKYDLYHEVLNATIQLNGKTASHGSRNILRVMEGADEIPDPEFWDQDISARFLFFRPADGKAFIGQYTYQEVDKIWGAISWQDEFDPTGRNIHVDYYSNAPEVDHLPPGSYVLGVLMNVTDGFTLDSYPQNNLDLTAFNLSESRILGLPEEIIIDFSLTTSHRIDASVLGGEEGYVWTYEIPNRPDWLTVKDSTNDDGLQVYLTADQRLPAGIYQVPVTIQATKGDRVIREKTTLVITKNDGPSLDCSSNMSLIHPSDPNVFLADRDGIRWMTVEMALQNVGNRDLFYSVQDNGVTVETPGNRVILPGQEHLIRVTLPLVGVPLPASGINFLWVELTTNHGYRACGRSYDPKEMLQYPIQGVQPFVRL